MSKKMGLISIVIPYVTNAKGIGLWMQRRHSNDEFDGLLEFPGGKIELGETPAQAAKREIREEVGVDVHEDSLKLFKVYYRELEAKKIMLNVFLYKDELGQFSPDSYVMLEADALEVLKEKIPWSNHEILNDFNKFWQNQE